MVGIKWESQAYIFSQVKFSLLQTVRGPPTPSHPGEFESDFNTSLIGVMNIHSPPDDWSSLYLKELRSSGGLWIFLKTQGWWRNTWSAIWPCHLNSSEGWNNRKMLISWYTMCITQLHMVVWCFSPEVSFTNKYKYMTTTTSSCCVNSKNDYNKDEDQNDDDGERAAPLHRIPRVDACFGRLPIHCFCSSHSTYHPSIEGEHCKT